MARRTDRGGTLVLKGYDDFLRATDRASRESKRYVRETFREVGDDVRKDSATRLTKYSPRSAARIRTVVRRRGISVEQTLRRTTGLRPDFGALQMRRALVPALDDNAPALERKLEHAMDRVADHFDNPA
jgi:hypothetical protein